MVFSVCEWGWVSPWTWAWPISNMWRVTTDIWPEWFRVMMIVETNAQLGAFAGPGHWNDPDMIEVGVNGTMFNLPGLPPTWLTETQSKAHFSLWSITAAPLILGNNIQEMPKWVLDIISNKQVIQVNQDALGKQGNRINVTESGPLMEGLCIGDGKCTSTQVWVKPLTDGNYAALLFNRGVLPSEMQFHEEDHEFLPLYHGEFGSNLGSFRSPY